MASSSSDVPPQPRRPGGITGANSGVGFEAAKTLAEAGAFVILGCRDLDRGRDAAARIKGATEVREVDTSSLASVRAFSGALDRPVDVLINNAGIMAVDEARSV